jgi:hypothetical protein
MPARRLLLGPSPPPTDGMELRMKKTIKPLPLRRQTLRNLSAVAGGGLTFVTQNTCLLTKCYACPDTEQLTVCVPNPFDTITCTWPH